MRCRLFTLAAAMSLLLCVATVVIFDDQERPLTDEDFAAVFPAVQQMDPMVLLFAATTPFPTRAFRYSISCAQLSTLT